MHEHHRGYHEHHHHDHERHDTEALRRLLAMLEHWIDHGDSHMESYREWAQKANASSEEEIAREIHLAVDDSESAKAHLKRAKAILAAKLVLKK
jgi:hypothetical protein